MLLEFLIRPVFEEIAPGATDADAALASELLFDLADQAGNSIERTCIVADRCRHAVARQNGSMGGQGDCLNFGPAEIDAYAHALPSGPHWTVDAGKFSQERAADR